MFLRLFLPLFLPRFLSSTSRLSRRLFQMCWQLNSLFFTAHTHRTGENEFDWRGKNTFPSNESIEKHLSLTRERWRNVEWQKEEEEKEGKKDGEREEILIDFVHCYAAHRTCESGRRRMAVYDTCDYEWCGEPKSPSKSPLKKKEKKKILLLCVSLVWEAYCLLQ